LVKSKNVEKWSFKKKLIERLTWKSRNKIEDTDKQKFERIVKQHWNEWNVKARNENESETETERAKWSFNNDSSVL
jgi:hypothetical protein